MYLRTLSDHLLDIGQNAVHAGASEIRLTIAQSDTTFSFLIEDNGKGMDEQTQHHIFDPFYTTRDHKIRKVGLGLPFLRDAAQSTGGDVRIDSKIGQGTKVEAFFRTDHIDCQPVGDVGGTLFSLITYSADADWMIERSFDEACYSIDTKSLKKALESDRPWESPSRLQWLQESLEELEQSIRHQG